MSRTRARTAAVVGAGAAGLVAARELLRDGHAVTVFERSGRVGGTWAYDARSDPDPLGLDPAAPGAVHGSLYASLRTNLPRELMGFSGFALQGRVFAGDPRTFPGHREVLAFLDAFAEESGVAGHVRLRAEVRRLRPLGPGEGWSVEWRGDAGDAEEVFDAVVVCNGHCTVPLVPKLRGIENWRGNHMHSHNYRTPEPFQDQVVVVVGLGASGVDIAREISKVAKEVHIASRYTQDRVGKVDIYQNVWLRSEVQSSQLSYLLLDSISLAFHGVTRKQQHVTVLMQLIACEYKQVDCIQDDGKVCFMEGSAVTADTILYCTGYRYHFPFLDVDDFTVDDNRVGPLYNHVFPPKYAPSLSFVGLPSKSIVLQTIEMEARWVARVLSGRAELPSEADMAAAVQEHNRRMEAAGKPKRHTHVLMPGWAEHIDWLAAQVGEPPLEARRRNMYEKALRCIWTLDERYRDTWDDDEDDDEQEEEEENKCIA